MTNSAFVLGKNNLKIDYAALGNGFYKTPNSRLFSVYNNRLFTESFLAL